MFEAHSVRKCASAIFVLRPSDISSMRYAVNRAIYGFCRAKRHEYNIAKVKDFYIAFAVKQKYRCETCLTISPIMIIFEIGIILNYLTHYDTFKLKVSIFYKKTKENTYLRSVSFYLPFSYLLINYRKSYAIYFIDFASYFFTVLLFCNRNMKS